MKKIFLLATMYSCCMQSMVPTIVTTVLPATSCAAYYVLKDISSIIKYKLQEPSDTVDFMRGYAVGVVPVVNVVSPVGEFMSHRPRAEKVGYTTSCAQYFIFPFAYYLFKNKKLAQNCVSGIRPVYHSAKSLQQGNHWVPMPKPKRTRVYKG